jgi:hypothetical protein
MVHRPAHRRSICVALVALALTGCSTIDSRIEEHAGTFGALPPAAQTRLRQGQIAIDDTKDMVYIALGEPDAMISRTDKTGTVFDLWSYAGVYYTRDAVWHNSSPFRRQRLHDDDFFYHGPQYVDVQHEYERLRIEFESGKVKAIDQVKR